MNKHTQPGLLSITKTTSNHEFGLAFAEFDHELAQIEQQLVEVLKAQGRAA